MSIERAQRGYLRGPQLVRRRVGGQVKMVKEEGASAAITISAPTARIPSLTLTPDMARELVDVLSALLG
ncbi:MAG TPA: hypothetical protein VFD92_04825 [Candidatus Binatia bacterium]|nr:hypothetical protein [Candidatus Binatia bacterium]